MRTLLFLIFEVVQYILGAFQLYDADSDGFITHKEMYDVMEAVYRMEVNQGEKF